MKALICPIISMKLLPLSFLPTSLYGNWWWDVTFDPRKRTRDEQVPPLVTLVSLAHSYLGNPEVLESCLTHPHSAVMATESSDQVVQGVKGTCPVSAWAVAALVSQQLGFDWHCDKWRGRGRSHTLELRLECISTNLKRLYYLREPGGTVIGLNFPDIVLCMSLYQDVFGIAEIIKHPYSMATVSMLTSLLTSCW